METASSVLTNGNQNHAEIQHEWDQEAANTLSSGNNGNQHRSDQLLNSIKAMAESLEPPLSSNECCIYKIPTLLHKLNEEAYTPQVISIGPFHHGTERLEPMKKLKLKYFQKFLRRIEDFNVLEILVNDIKVHEERVRDCYEETINFSSDDFVKLILLDGSFLIGFFHRIWFQGIHSVVRENPKSWPALWLDLLLLENQLPFFVLNILFSHARLANDMFPSFTSLAIYCLEMSHGQKLPQNLATNGTHLLDLVSAFFVPSSRELPPQERGDLASADQLHTASQLYEAGVKFKMSASKCLVDLKFTNGTLEIPRIYLDNSTETIYRNVIAFEQCQHTSYDSHLTDYIVLLKSLINTPKDAELLIRKGIIINCLANCDAVASLFHNLDMNIVYHGEDSAYRGLFRDLNAFYNNTKHTWKATLKRDYLGTPWKVASTAAAVTLLLLTLVQAICSIIQVVKI